MPADPDAPIETERLRLVPLTRQALRLLLAGDRAAASRSLGLRLPPEFPAGTGDGFLEWQLRRIERLPARRAWCARAIVRAEDDEVIGTCGFHGPPELVGRAEIGYTVFERFRRSGYATEAAAGLVGWAERQGERVVYASVAPGNLGSLGVVRRLGFRHTGDQMDEIDGLELVFQRELRPAGEGPGPAGRA
jgi:ribosomal-protein-alanine N-acetyltransferase